VVQTMVGHQSATMTRCLALDSATASAVV